MSPAVCLARSLREWKERDVYVASAWHPDSESGLRKNPGPGNCAPAQIIVASLNTYPGRSSAAYFSALEISPTRLLFHSAAPETSALRLSSGCPGLWKCDASG